MVKVVPSKLYTTASQKVEEKVEDELKIPDPPLSEEEAIATVIDEDAVQSPVPPC